MAIYGIWEDNQQQPQNKKNLPKIAKYGYFKQVFTETNGESHVFWHMTKIGSIRDVSAVCKLSVSIQSNDTSTS